MNGYNDKEVLFHGRFHIAINLLGIITLGLIAALCIVQSMSQPAAPITKEVVPSITRITAVGDSITEGTVDKADAYPAQLQNLLGDTYEVSNYGLSKVTLQSTGDKPYTSEQLYQQSLASDPAIVLIMLGTNDSKQKNWNAARYKEELETFVDTYKNLPTRPKVYLLTAPVAHVYENMKNDDVDAVVVEHEVVPIIKEVAAAKNIPYIDIFEVTKDHKNLFGDGVHPNAEGYGIIAKKVYEAIKETP